MIRKIANTIALLGVFLLFSAPLIAQDENTTQDEKTTSKQDDKSTAKQEKKTTGKKGEKQKKSAAVEPAVVWHDPGDVSQLNLLYGAGGEEDAPDPNATYTFISEDLEGTSPKFDVKDENGVTWRVKMGAEPQSETSASRLMWAAGFFTNEDYFLPQIKVQGLPKLSRGNNWISSGGVVRIVRLKRKLKGEKDLGDWNWSKNECGPAREFNALRAMMAVINNWDLKVVNNKMVGADGERRCMVSDIGATFGKTGNFATRSKSDVKGFADSPFIETINTDTGTVDFVMHTRQSILNIVQHSGYEERAHMENITKHIPIEDARWLGDRLGMLSVDQIGDAFRAGGYTPQQVEEYTASLEKRIDQLKGLGSKEATTSSNQP